MLNAGVVMAAGTTLSRGIVLLAGGYVSNSATGTISAYGVGVFISGGVGTAVNSGHISSSGLHPAVDLTGGGTIINQLTGTLSSAIDNDIFITLGSGMVMNAGIILASDSHAAIDLFEGGYVSNASGGTISSSGGVGIYVTGSAGTVVNAGAISFLGPTGDAVNLSHGGFVSNASTGTITTPFENDIYVTGGYARVINAGLILTTSTQHAAVNLAKTGYIGNASTGTIVSNYFGAANDFGGIATVVNAGLITSTANSTVSTSDGVFLGKGGVVVNQTTGTIGGGVNGILVTNGVGSVTNAGTVAGGIFAVNLASGFANRLIIDPGASFGSEVTGGNTIGSAVASTLELASGTSTGTLTGLGSKYIDFAQITIDSGATWMLAGANTLVAGQTMTVTGAAITDSGNLVNDGGIYIDPSTMTVAGLTGTGAATIAAGSKLNVQGTVASGETIAFSGSGGYLYLGNPGAVTGSVTNFGMGDTIDLKGISSVNYSGGVLSFEGGGFDLSLAPGQTLTSSASSNGVEFSALCFCTNTLILTPSGERPVQQLAVGDMVLTHRREARPIVWIGVGKVLATRGRRNAATPVIVRKGALADNVPHHDLRVTKGHAFYLDDVLIPVEFLVNHRSIEWDDRAQEVELYHIELEAHDILVANGAPAESYRDDGNRWLFRNANTGWDLPPLEPFAPVLTGGGVVDSVWLRLLERAGPRPGIPLTDDPDLHLLVDGERIDSPSRHGMAHIFTLPGRPTSARVCSRAGAPAELGLARDPRVLGVALCKIAIRQGTQFRVMEASDAALSEGFHAFESDNGLRWTDGDSLLPAAAFDGFDGPMELVLHVGCTALYPLYCGAEGRPAALVKPSRCVATLGGHRQYDSACEGMTANNGMASISLIS